jgi:hypothetical protein
MNDFRMGLVKIDERPGKKMQDRKKKKSGLAGARDKAADLACRVEFHLFLFQAQAVGQCVPRHLEQPGASELMPRRFSATSAAAS